MHDEACPHFEDYINNMMAGHEFVMKEFGVTPRVGWQIDPFGHSSANARLFAEMGFDAFIFARLDYEDREKRQEEGTMEFVWRPMWDYLANTTQILTHALYTHYSAPDGLDWDTMNVVDPFVDDLTMDTYNAPEKSAMLLDTIMEYKSAYPS